MPSGLSFDQKRDFVVGELFPMLRNDLRRVIESVCHQHSSGGSGPNFTAALVCMIALEVLGRLSHPGTIGDTAAAVNELAKLSTVDPRYATYPTVRWHIFRNGIAHLFFPKQLTTENVQGRVVWAETPNAIAGHCIDFLTSAQGAPTLAAMRPHHLADQRLADGTVVLIVVPHVLCLDINKALEAFANSLSALSPQARADFESGFEKWWDGIATVMGSIPQAEISELQAVT